MRQEKFDYNKDAYNNDDIQYAFECNGLAEKLKDINCIVAEVCGENDGNDWFWVLQMTNGKFCNASGWCDYTGWDCRSSAKISEEFDTPEQAINDLKISDYDDRKNIKWCLEKQITEEIPFAIYQDDQNIKEKI